MERALITVTILVPIELVVVEPGETPDELPKQLGPQSRVPPLHVAIIQGLPIAVGRGPKEMFSNEQSFDPAKVSSLVEASDLTAAVRLAQPAIEEAIDGLVFQIQASIRILALDAIDVTFPLTSGEERKVVSFTNAETIISPKFAAMPPDFRWKVFPVSVPSLHSSRSPTDPKIRMALWWYAKALSTPFAIDKFVALWSATELLWEVSGDHRLLAPYTTRCGHDLIHCPECGQDIKKLVRGRSLRDFLEAGGVSPENAKRMWGVRQAVHGVNVFSHDKVQAVGELAGELCTLLLVILKQTLGLHPEDPPVVMAAGGPTLRPEMTLMGHRPINAEEANLVQMLDQVR